MANELDDQYQRTQPPDRSQKVLDVLGAMKFNADYMRKHDHCQRAGKGRVNTGGRRKKTGNQAQQIAGGNVKKYRGDERKKGATLLPGNLAGRAASAEARLVCVGRRRFHHLQQFKSQRKI